MIFCTKCGKPLDDNTLKFCPSCGEKINHDRTSDNNKNNKVIIIGGILLVSLIAIIIFGMYKNGNNDVCGFQEICEIDNDITLMITDVEDESSSRYNRGFIIEVKIINNSNSSYYISTENFSAIDYNGNVIYSTEEYVDGFINKDLETSFIVQFYDNILDSKRFSEIESIRMELDESNYIIINLDGKNIYDDRNKGK